MLLEKKRTDPSPIAALTPPVWLLRADAQVRPVVRSWVQAILWPAGMFVPQHGMLSPWAALGGCSAVKVLAPMPGRIQTPRQSLLLLPLGSSQVRTSLMNRVLLEPS